MQLLMWDLQDLIAPYVAFTDRVDGLFSELTALDLSTHPEDLRLPEVIETARFQLLQARSELDRIQSAHRSVLAGLQARLQARLQAPVQLLQTPSENGAEGMQGSSTPSVDSEEFEESVESESSGIDSEEI